MSSRLEDEKPDLGPVRYLTYADASAALRVDPEAIKKRAQRNGWPRLPGNDGRMRIGIPEKLLPRDPASPEAIGAASEDAMKGRTDSLSASLSALAAHLRDAREEAAQAQARFARISGAIELEILRLVRPGSAARKQSRHTVAMKLRKIREAADRPEGTRPADTSPQAEPAA
jgi:hypothetical protein